MGEEAEKYFEEKIKERLDPKDLDRKVEGGPSELVKKVIEAEEKRRSVKIPKDETPIDENRKAEEGELIVVLAGYDYKLKCYDDYVGGTFDSSELEEAIETAKRYKRTSSRIQKEIFVGVYDDKGRLCFWAR